MMISQKAMRWIGCAAFAMVSTVGFSLSQLTPVISLEQMSRDADQIILGNVLDEECKIVKNNFETQYTIQVAQNLKSRDGNLQAGEAVVITLPGGVRQVPPLTQYIMGQPTMYKGQEVALFLRAGTGVAPKVEKNGPNPSTFASSYKIIGMNQGCFSVITRADTGEKVVARLNLEDYGFVNSAKGTKELVTAIAERAVPTVNKALTRQADNAGDVRTKDPLEMTSSDGKKLVTEERMQSAELQKALRERGGSVPVQSLDKFKNQINGFVINSN